MQFLEKPHPFIFNHKSVIIPGLITFLLVSLFAPFGFHSLTITNRLLMGVALATLSSLSILLIVSGLKKLRPNLILEDNWTVGKEVTLFLSIVATICLLIFLSFILLDLSSSAPLTLFKLVVLYTSLISLFPITILVLFEQYHFQKENAQKAVELTKTLSNSIAVSSQKSSATPFVIFQAENGKVELQLTYDKLVYLKSAGNYVEIFYLDQYNVLQKKLIRNRLKHFMDVLSPKVFFHAHKSYIVNKSHIQRIEGNARNFVLLLSESSEKVPVSRSKSQDLSTLLKSTD